jgi:hypothetical protein
VEGLELVPGGGLVACVDGRRVAAGTAALLGREGVAGEEVAAAQAAVAADGATACLVAVDGRFAGWLRWEALAKKRKQENCSFHMCIWLPCLGAQEVPPLPASAAPYPQRSPEPLRGGALPLPPPPPPPHHGSAAA